MRRETTRPSANDPVTAPAASVVGGSGDVTPEEKWWTGRDLNPRHRDFQSRGRRVGPPTGTRSLRSLPSDRAGSAGTLWLTVISEEAPTTRSSERAARRGGDLGAPPGGLPQLEGWPRSKPASECRGREFAPRRVRRLSGLRVPLEAKPAELLVNPPARDAGGPRIPPWPQGAGPGRVFDTCERRGANPSRGPSGGAPRRPVAWAHHAAGALVRPLPSREAAC